MIVIGVDPGTIKTGFGVVRRDGGRLIRIDSGTIRLDKSREVEERLVPLKRELDAIITANGPDEAAVESLFFSKNAMSALKLGLARGVVLLALKERGLPLCSYPPALVKRSIAGQGRAEKGQIQRVVQAILGLGELPDEDEADALAIAICHLNASGLGANTGPTPDIKKRLRPARREPRSK